MIWLLGGYMWLFVHRPFEVWPALGDLQIERVYMLLMLAYWVVQPNKGWMPNRLHLALVLFTLVMTVAWVASPYMGMPDCTLVAENYYKVVVFYILVVTSVRTEDALRQLVLMYLVAVGLYAGHSLLEYIHGRCMWRMGIRRLIGVDESYGDPNGFAAGLVLALPLTLPFWASRLSWWGRPALVGFTGLALVCILLTGSRAGFLGLGVCTLLCLFAMGRVKAALALFVLVAVSAPIAWYSLPEELQNRYTTIVDPSVGPKNAQVSAEGRIDGLVFGYEAWQKSPLLGHGPGGFKYATGREGGAHNVYGQVISEIGAIGVLAFLGLLSCFWLNWREARRSYRGQPDQPRTFAFHLSRAIGLNVLLLLFLGWSGHNVFRYYWVWFAAFQVIALHCIRVRAAAADAWEAAPPPLEEEEWAAMQPAAAGAP